MNPNQPLPNERDLAATPGKLEGLVTMSHVIYGLHAVSALTGMLSPAFVVTSFLSGWPSIIGVILNYVKRDEARGTYIESHFRWQIRTFWFALLWVVIAFLLALTFVGIPVAVMLAFGAGVWILYRIIRGWLKLWDGRPMPM